jgi:hypothetical protein
VIPDCPFHGTLRRGHNIATEGRCNSHCGLNDSALTESKYNRQCHLCLQPIDHPGGHSFIGTCGAGV